MAKKTKLTLYPVKGKLSEAEWQFCNRFAELHHKLDVNELQKQAHAKYRSLARTNEPIAVREKAVATEMENMKRQIEENRAAAYNRWFAPKSKKSSPGSSSDSIETIHAPV